MTNSDPPQVVTNALLASGFPFQTAVAQVIRQAAPRYTLIGEEIYSAGAYLGRTAAHLASLQGQDLVRALVILLILLGAIAATVLGNSAVTALLALTQ